MATDLGPGKIHMNSNSREKIAESAGNYIHKLLKASYDAILRATEL